MAKDVKSLQSVSVVLIAYNEKQLIHNALERCTQALLKDFEDFEIILVDDGSNDGTGEVMEEYAKKIGQIKVFHNGINLNLGITVQRGFANATKDYVVFNSVDLPLAPEDISGLVKRAKDVDVLVLERKTYEGATKWRKLTSKINQIMLHILFPFAARGIRDLNYTQIYRREILPFVMPLAKSPAFTTPEMILRAKYRKLRVEPVLTDYHPRTAGKTSLGKPHDIIWSMYDMFRFRLISWMRLL